MRGNVLVDFVAIPLLAYLVGVLIMACFLYQAEPNAGQVFSAGGNLPVAMLLSAMVMPIFGVIPYAVAAIPVTRWSWPQWSRVGTVAVLSLLVYGALCMAGNPGVALRERIAFSFRTACWAWLSGLSYGLPLLALIYTRQIRQSE